MSAGVRTVSPQDIESELKPLQLPVINDFRNEFERKARELGFDPATLLTSLGSIQTKDSTLDHESVSE